MEKLNTKFKMDNSKSKTILESYKVGDILLVKKKKFWSLKQYPKVNGGIVVISHLPEI